VQSKSSESVLSMKYWEIPKLWPGSTVTLLGGGPSLVDSLMGVKLNLSKVIAINNAFELGSWIDMCFFGDARWYWWNEERFKVFPGLKVTVNRNPKPGESVENVSGLKIVRSHNSKGLCTEANSIYFNSSSGAAAVNLAYQLGAKRIILFGYDMRYIDGKSNWKPHPIPRSTGKPFTNFLTPFRSIAKDAKALGLEIWNATPGSALTVFPMMAKEEVNDCLGRI